jgi:hypothetical protein
MGRISDISLAEAQPPATLDPMDSTRTRCLTILCAVALSWARAHAGPDIDEATSSRPDAGATPATARQIRGLNLSGSTVLGRVSGTVSSATALVAGVSDVVDMFVFSVADPATFEATVERGVGFETSLWLFALKPASGGTYEARPVAGNNAKFEGAAYSSVTFPPGDYEPGLFALALTQRGIRPKTYDTGGPVEMFTQPPPSQTGLMLPINQRMVLKVWQGYTDSGGTYGVQVQGASFIASTPGTGECGSQFAGSCFTAHSPKGCDDLICCTTVCQIDAFCCSANWDSLCATLAAQNCVLFECSNPTCPADLNDDGQVDGGDLGLMLSAWGPCS